MREIGANRAGARRDGAVLRNSGAPLRPARQPKAPTWCNHRGAPCSSNHLGACAPFCTLLVSACGVRIPYPRRISVPRRRA